MELYKRSLFRDDWKKGKRKAIDAELKIRHNYTTFPTNRDGLKRYQQDVKRVIEETSQEFRRNYIEPKYTRDESLIEIAKRLNIDLL